MTLPDPKIRPRSTDVEARKLAREKAAAGLSPLRTAIVDSLSLTPKTVAELAGELRLPVEKVRYNLNRMRAAGLVEARGKTRRRGLVENLYSVDLRRHFIDVSDATLVPSRRMDQVNARVLRVMFQESTKAVRAGTFSSRPEYVFIRYLLPLDAAAWRAVVDLLDETAERVFTLRESSLRRLEESGEEEIIASAMIMLFERQESRPDLNGHDVAGRWDDVLTSMADPLRCAVVDLLTLGPASVAELADQLGVPAEQVRYQVKRLREVGIVTIHGRGERRGALEHIYSADIRKAIFSREEALAAPDGSRKRQELGGLRRVFREALQAARAGAFHDRDDFSILRIPLRLDARGFSEISAHFDAVLEHLRGLTDESLARLEAGGEEAMPATAMLLLFETAD